MKYELKVENIKCSGCAHSITTGLKKLKGITVVDVDIEHGIIRVETTEGTQREAIIEKLHHMGYPEPGKGSGLTKATSYVSCMIGKVSS
jgi:copper chaperone